MATTTPWKQDYDSARQDVIFGSQAASTKIPAGTLAMNDAGVAKPLTDTGIQGGALLLGVAPQTYENTDASTKTVRMLFHRATGVTLAGKTGDAPTAANVGGTIYLSDNNTCKVTNAGSDQAVVLVAIVGSLFRVRLP